MKRILSVFLIVMMLAALALPSAAAHVSATEAADALAALGLLRGTGNGYELERSITRAEAAVMLLRLLGKEAEAEAETDACPFDDGGWAAPQLTYAWKIGLVKGQSETHFGSADPIGSRDYMTMLLRALGYSDTEGDFRWEQSIAFSDSIGLSHGEYTANGAFLREDMALLTYTALTLNVHNTERTLAERLYQNGVLSGSALRAARLPYAADAERTVYDSMEIYERCASAIIYIELYANEEQLRLDEPSSCGSGFFITGDGVAVMCYHELENMEYVRVTTLDGRRYDVTGVLSYDPLWDSAVIRVSRTDLDGNTVRFFPYLDLGDSDMTCAGEPVYALSNALGLIDNITDGVLSNRLRNVDDPDYPVLQISAPISQGSSGGALVNRFGEVIGILFASFANGQNMNLAIPINVIASTNLNAAGVSLKTVRETENAKKAAATLSVSQDEVQLAYGEKTTVLVTHTAPGLAMIRYQIDCYDVVACSWGSFNTKHSVPLTIQGIGNGEAVVTITFAVDGYGNETQAEIHVVVTGAPEEQQEDFPSGTTGI